MENEREEKNAHFSLKTLYHLRGCNSISEARNLENKELLRGIKDAIREDRQNVQAYKDFVTIMELMVDEDYGGDRKQTYKENMWLRNELTKRVTENKDPENTYDFYELLKNTYLWSARDVFEDYLYFLEWDRKPEERFYQPRAKVLGKLVRGIQMLVDDKLDELFLSQPPRTGKTTMLLFLETWLIGRDSERSNLYSAFSDTITKAFYNGVLEVIQDEWTYKWKEVFPNAQIVATNSMDETVNIDRRKRYPSLVCRSLYGTLNGACDCDGFLIADDLIGGIEEALNKDRLIAAWSKVDNNLLPRCKMGAKVLWCGTRWSNADPIGLRLSALQSDERFSERRYAVINLPATDSNGESNFDYEYGVGFSTEFYRQRKASFDRNEDLASWYAQYMGEPIERTGTMFEPADMKYFNGELPDEPLLRKFMAVDPAWGGGDFVAAPICYQYESGVYVVDVVYTNGDKTVSQPLIANKIVKWAVQSAQFECNKTTLAYKEKVEELLKELRYRCNITYKAALPITKEFRIFERSAEIREFYFLEGIKRDRAYDQFMTNLFAFRLDGKNKHDDAPDSLAMAAEMITTGRTNMVVARRRF